MQAQSVSSFLSVDCPLEKHYLVESRRMPARVPQNQWFAANRFGPVSGKALYCTNSVAIFGRRGATTSR